jgi:iron-sulfur cluster assembly protein
MTQMTDGASRASLVTMTELATSKVREILERQNKLDHVLRVYVRGMSCSGPAFGMALDQAPREDDLVAEIGGVKLVVDPLSAPYLEGAQIDFVDALTGSGFTITNPNQVRAGGCGSGGCACGH